MSRKSSKDVEREFEAEISRIGLDNTQAGPVASVVIRVHGDYARAWDDHAEAWLPIDVWARVLPTIATGSGHEGFWGTPEIQEAPESLNELGWVMDQ